jgi:hypothetical protein
MKKKNAGNSAGVNWVYRMKNQILSRRSAQTGGGSTDTTASENRKLESRYSSIC